MSVKAGKVLCRLGPRLNPCCGDHRDRIKTDLSRSLWWGSTGINVGLTRFKTDQLDSSLNVPSSVEWEQEIISIEN
jgi:hypothetical protein